MKDSFIYNIALPNEITRIAPDGKVRKIQIIILIKSIELQKTCRRKFGNTV